MDGDQLWQEFQAMGREELSRFVDPIFVEQAMQGLLKLRVVGRFQLAYDCETKRHTRCVKLGDSFVD